MKVKLKVGEIDITPKNKVIIHISEFNAKNKIDIRSWFATAEGEWLPTKRGLTLELQHRDAMVKLLNLIDVPSLTK